MMCVGDRIVQSLTWEPHWGTQVTALGAHGLSLVTSTYMSWPARGQREEETKDQISGPTWTTASSDIDLAGARKSRNVV